MTDSELKIERIDVTRAPGFETGGPTVENLSAGINVVYGSNASGKSTLARSIQAVLWPRVADEESSFVGAFDVDGDDWRVTVRGCQGSYQLNGVDENGPNLPAAVERDRYHLSLHDLLQFDTRNESFAEHIAQASRGGIDLDAAYEAAGLNDSPSTRNISEYQDATSARSELQSARQDLSELADQQQKLPGLRERHEEAKDAADRVRMLEQAIDYRNAKDELSSAEAALEGYPDILSNVNGTEAERTRDLAERIEEKRQENADAKRSLEEAKESIEEASLPEDGVSDGVIERLKTRQDTLHSLENQAEALEQNLADAEKRRRRAREDIPLDVDDETLASLEPAAWPAIADFAETAEELNAEREAHEALQDLFADSTEQPADHSTFLNGRQALEEWLSAPASETASDGTAVFRTAAVSAALVAAAGILLGVLVNPFLFVFVFVAVGLLWHGIRARNADQDESDPRAPFRESFERLDVGAPDEWTVDGVQSRLSDLYDEIADSHLDKKRADRRETLAADIESLEDREAAHEARRAELVDEYGVAPETSDVELAALTKGVLRWQDPNDVVEGLLAKQEKTTDQIATNREELTAELEPYRFGAVEDAATSKEFIRDLEGRKQDHENATREVERAERTIESAESKLADLESQREEIFTELRLEPDEDDHLRNLCEQVETYRGAKQAVGQAEAQLAREAEKLEGYQDFDPALKEQTKPELETRKRAAEETASAVEEIKKQITTIETNIQNAKEDTKVEALVAEKERKLDALAEKRDADAAAMVGDVLVEYLRDVTEESSRPDVFDRARELLTRITHGRYRLLIDEHEFRAYDTVNERGFALDELSSGTRVQVLLAVRVAFVEQQEQGVKLPLLMDETLANCDDRRAEAIIEAITEIARNGRQVFYFTAQGDEVVKWQHALRDADGVDDTTIDLAAITDGTDSVDIPDLDTVAFEQNDLPDSSSHDHQSYGDALDVPPVASRAGAGSVHLWYVVEDLDVLHNLLSYGIERWGQLGELLDRTDGTHVVGDADRLEAIQRDGAALEEFITLWQVGRGKPVDRAALNDSGSVSRAFIDRVAKLAADVDGDGERLIEALRNGQVKNFRAQKMDELEQYLENQGYIGQREPHSPESITVQIVGQLTATGLSREDARERAEILLERWVPDRAEVAT